MRLLLAAAILSLGTLAGCSADKSADTAAPATAGDGFFVDDLALTSTTYVACTTDCYVDAATGDDLNGGDTPATAKKTIQAAVDQVSVGGTVHVAAGTYAENVTVDKRVTIDGAGSTPADTVVTG